MWTAEEILEVAAGLRRRASETFDRDGYLVPVAFVFGDRGERSVNIVAPEGAIADEPVGQHLLAQAVRRMARERGARAIAQVNESWLLDGAAAQAHRGGSIENVPERREVLVFSLETYRSGIALWVAPIERPAPPAKARAAAWAMDQHQKRLLRGPFYSLLEEVN
jgi:hypothetical protein